MSEIAPLQIPTKSRTAPRCGRSEVWYQYRSEQFWELVSAWRQSGPRSRWGRW